MSREVFLLGRLAYPEGMLRWIGKHWPCFLLLALTLLDLVVVDPLPFVDETLLAGLTAACFGRRGKKKLD